jgi:hypothetical protein
VASACSSTRPPPTCLLVGFGNRTLRTSFNESRRAWAWQWAAAAGRLNTNFTYFLPRRIRSEFCEFYAQGPNSARISGHRIFSTVEFGPYLPNFWGSGPYLTALGGSKSPFAMIT